MDEQRGEAEHVLLSHILIEENDVWFPDFVRRYADDADAAVV